MRPRWVICFNTIPKECIKKVIHISGRAETYVRIRGSVAHLPSKRTLVTTPWKKTKCTSIAKVIGQFLVRETLCGHEPNYKHRTSSPLGDGLPSLGWCVLVPDGFSMGRSKTTSRSHLLLLVAVFSPLLCLFACSFICGDVNMLSTRPKETELLAPGPPSLGGGVPSPFSSFRSFFL